MPKYWGKQISLIISPEDLDSVTCMHCGICPKIVNSDGIAIMIFDNMVFDYEDHSEPPNLDEFKLDLVSTSLKRSFYQNEPPKTYNMLKLPLIIAPGLLGKQINNDFQKKSLLDKEIKYKQETFIEFHRFIENRELNILSVSTMNVPELKEWARKLKLENVADKSGELLRKEVTNLVKVFVAGQVSIIYVVVLSFRAEKGTL